MPAPTPQRLFFSLFAVIVLVFLRPPTTNFIFDEQEALLGNPFLQGQGPFHEAFLVDFWGRAPERTIGAYRPLPNLIWRSLAFSLSWNTPWLLSVVSLAVHAGTSTLLALALGRVLSRTPEERRALFVWATGLAFAAAGVLSEAICAVVGLADLLVGLFSALFFFVVATRPERTRLLVPVAWGCAFFGLLSKETMMTSLFLFPAIVLFLGSEGRWRSRLTRALGVGVACAGALVSFVAFRREVFPAKLAEPAKHFGDGSSVAGLAEWFAQPKMPADVINNPLFEASFSERLATASLLFVEQWGQMLVPVSANGDYSFPAFPVADWDLMPIAGMLLFVSLLSVLLIVSWRALGPADSPGMRLLGLGLFWALASYVPISNGLVLLPTIRGERLLYSPMIGVVVALVGVAVLLPRVTLRTLSVAFFSWVAFHGAMGRVHSLRYRGDVAFWRATATQAPSSAKAHLNLGVMLGARGDEEGRLKWTKSAAGMAPQWPMGQVYLGDSLCRLKRMDEAWEHYRVGLLAQPNSKALTALALQCLWDEGAFESHKHELLDGAADHSGTWLAFFVRQLVSHGEENEGIPPKYRPRRYNAAASANR